MAECLNPTLYPIILSSIDGECVFAEHDLSTPINDQSWQNIHDVVMWCCPWLYFWGTHGGAGNPTIGAGPRFVPNTDNPVTTTTIWITPTAAVGSETNPGGTGLMGQGHQYLELGGGVAGLGSSTYWEATNPNSESLFSLEIGSEVTKGVDPIKITMGVSSVSGGEDSGGEDIFRLGINPAQTISYEGTTAGSPADGWGTEESTEEDGTGSRYNFKIQPSFNRTLEACVNVCAASTSGAEANQVLTYDGTSWTAQDSTGGGSTSLGGLTNVSSAVDSASIGSFLYTNGAGDWTAKGPGQSIITNLFLGVGQSAAKPTLKVCGAGTTIAEFWAAGGTDAAFTVNKTGAVESSQGLNVTGLTALQLTNTGSLNVTGSQLTIAVGAGQTSAPFIVSDSGANHIFYIDASANLFTSGGVDVSGNKITQVGTPTNAQDAANKLYVDEMASGVSGDYILKDGSIAFTGNQSMGSNKLTSVTDPTNAQDAATKLYVDEMASGVSGNYILKDGSVAFTGNQSMGSNKLTSVTNPVDKQDAATKLYVDFVTSATSSVGIIGHENLSALTTGDPHTQYIFNAPTGGDRNQIVQSNSGRDPFSIKAHASNNTYLTKWINPDDVNVAYIDKDFNFRTSGSVSGTSGTVDGALATNLLSFQRPWNHNAYRSATFGSNDTDLIYINTTDQDANFPIPAGETLKILAAYGRCKTGGTAGTTTWSLGIRAWDDQAHSSFTNFTCASNTTTATNTYLNVVGRGSLGNPLASISGGSYVAGMVFIKHENDGGGSSSNDKHTIDIYGVFV